MWTLHPGEHAIDRKCSGRKIIEILKKNPKKDPENYDEDDIAHMRKVSNCPSIYCPKKSF